MRPVDPNQPLQPLQPMDVAAAPVAQYTPPPPEPTDPESMYDIAANSRSPDRFYKMAAAHVDDPEATAVALHGAKVVTENAKKFDSLITPAENAATPQERNMKIADAYKTVKDDPQWGTALMMYFMGQKKTAALMITGGKPEKVRFPDVNGNYIEETKNELGEVLSRRDVKTGQPVSDEEYNQRGGQASLMTNTMRYLNAAALNKANTEGLIETTQATNTWAAGTKALAAKVDNAFSQLMDMKGNDLTRDKFAEALGIVTQANSNTANKSQSLSTFKQLSSAANAKEGTTIDKSLTASIGPGIFKADGKGGITNGTTISLSADALANKQKTLSSGDENTQQLNTSQEALINKWRNEGIDATTQAKLREALNTFTDLTKTNDELVAKAGKPDYIILPSASKSTDRYANMAAQLKQYQFNKDAVAGFKDYYNKNIGNHDPRQGFSPPDRGAMEAAYTRTQEYQDLLDRYRKETTDLLSQNFAKKEEPKPSGPQVPPKQEETKSEKSVGVKPKRSMDDVAKSLGLK
jgi:hypothetical protein